MARMMGKLPYVLTAASVWLWAFALSALWTRAFDGSAVSQWITLSMTLLAFAIGLAAPLQVVRLGQVVLRWAGGPWAGAGTPAEIGPKEPPREMSRVLGVTLIIAAGLSLVSAMALLVSARAATLLADAFVLNPRRFLAAQAGLKLAAMLGWGAGAGLIWQTHALARGGRGRDPAWPAHDDWLWGLALAAAGGSILWRYSLELPTVALLAGAQVVLGLVLVRWPRGADRPISGGVGPVREPSWLREAGVVALSAGAAGLVVLQCRAVSDMPGLADDRKLLLASLWLMAVAFAHSRWMRRGRFGLAGMTAGGMLTAGTAVTMHLVLAWSALAAGASARWVQCLGLLACIPTAVAVVIVLADQRRQIIEAGGSPRRWTQAVLMGGSLGILAPLVAMAWSLGLVVTIVMILTVMVAMVALGIVQSQNPRANLTWLIAGSVLILGATGALTQSASRPGRERKLLLRSGPWLTAWQHGPQAGYLPMAPSGFEPQLDRAIGPWLEAGAIGAAGDEPWPIPGWRWLIVNPRPILADSAGPMMADLAAAEPALYDLPIWRGRRGQALGPILRGGRARYNGAVYAPVRCDHPQGRALWNAEMLSALAERITRPGILVFHLQCGGEDVTPLLAAARTIHEHPQLGPAVAVVRVGPSGAEMLILSATDRLESTRQELVDALGASFRQGAIVLRTQRLAVTWAGVEPAATAVGSWPAPGRAVSAEMLQHQLQADPLR